GEVGFLHRSELRGAACGFCARCPLEPITAKLTYPGGDGLLVHTQDQGNLCNALAIDDRENGETILHLAQLAEALRSLHTALHCFTIGSRHGKTKATHRDVPPH